MTHVLYIPADSQIAEVREVSSYTDYRALLNDGWLESLRFPEYCTVTGFCDEEGKIKHLPINHLATLVWNSLWFDYTKNFPEDVLRGPVIFSGSVDQHGNETDVDHAFVTLVGVLASQALRPATPPAAL